MLKWDGYKLSSALGFQTGCNEMCRDRDALGYEWLEVQSCPPPPEIEMYAVYPADCWEGKEPIAACSEV